MGGIKEKEAEVAFKYYGKFCDHTLRNTLRKTLKYTVEETLKDTVKHAEGDTVKNTLKDICTQGETARHTSEYTVNDACIFVNPLRNLLRNLENFNDSSNLAGNYILNKHTHNNSVLMYK